MFEDHPRSRGEHKFDAGHVSPIVGSSPLARGARFLARQNS
ncbi:hypothetical protein HMPREF1255_1332 [Propionimicrobium sp. BV2F7]|nr:hypothetical protein HMPREF1255_1332 [Propionimicrobium sp. BV2F7]